MSPKQRNYNGYSLVHPHTRTDPFPESLQEDGMMIAVVQLSLHISWVSESITMSSQINKGTGDE